MSVRLRRKYSPVKLLLPLVLDLRKQWAELIPRIPRGLVRVIGRTLFEDKDTGLGCNLKQGDRS
jgi:hypothetical protein